MAIKIAVSNAKGGVGKTTTAIMLAQELQRMENKVLVIDGDPQCNTTTFYGAEVAPGTASLADILCSLDTMAEEAIQHCENGDIIPCEQDLKDAENTVHADMYRFLHLQKAGKSINQMYDYIIVDTPPNEGVILRNVLNYVDYVVIPAQISGWSIDGLVAFYKNTIYQAQDLSNPNLKIAGILLTRYNRRTKEAKRIKEVAENIANKIGTKVFNTTIRDSVKAVEALTDYCVPLYEYENKSSVQMDYEEFVKELLATIAGKE